MMTYTWREEHDGGSTNSLSYPAIEDRLIKATKTDRYVISGMVTTWRTELVMPVSYIIDSSEYDSA